MKTKKAEAGGLVMIKLIPLILIVLVIVAVIIAFVILDIPETLRNFIPDFFQPGGVGNDKIEYKLTCDFPIAKIIKMSSGLNGIYFFDTTGTIPYYYYSRLYLDGLNIYADERRFNQERFEIDTQVGTAYRGLVILNNELLNAKGDLYAEVLEDFLEDDYLRDHLTQFHEDLFKLHGSFLYKNLTTNEIFFCRDQEYSDEDRALYEDESFATLNNLDFFYHDSLGGDYKLSLKIVETEEGSEIRTKTGDKAVGYLRKDDSVFMIPGFQDIMGFSRYGVNYLDAGYGLKEFTNYKPTFLFEKRINFAFYNLEAVDKLHESKLILGKFYAKKKSAVIPAVRSRGISQKLNLVFDSWIDDRAVVSWNFEKGSPEIELYPNGDYFNNLGSEDIEKLNINVFSNIAEEDLVLIRRILSSKIPLEFALGIRDAINSGRASINDDKNYGVHWKEISYLLYGSETPPEQGEANK